MGVRSAFPSPSPAGSHPAEYSTAQLCSHPLALKGDKGSAQIGELQMIRLELS